MSNNTYCPLPFVHFALKPSGHAKPCCRFSTFLSEEEEFRNWNNVNHNVIGTEKTLNSNEFSSVRQAMINGEKVPGCWKCYKEEETAGYSMRTLYNKRFSDHDNSVKLKYLEVSFGNYCNLSCRTCNSGLSTSWYNDDVALSKKYKDRKSFNKIIDIPYNWKPEDFEHVEEIKFVGGEPMLNPNFDKFLQDVLATGRGKSIKLTIFTNSSWFPKPKIIDLLKNFENVFIWLSIDSYKEKNNYIRHGSNWNTLSNVALKYLDLEKESSVFSVTLTPTLNILNIFDIDNLIDWWVLSRGERGLSIYFDASDKSFQPGDIVFSSVYDPESLSVKNVPNKEELIKKYLTVIKKFEKDENYEFFKRTYYKIISSLERYLDETVDIVSFVQYTKDLDKLRNQNFKKTFPDLYQAIENELQKNNLSYNNINGKIND